VHSCFYSQTSSSCFVFYLCTCTVAVAKAKLNNIVHRLYTLPAADEAQ
jgi:hypothetical protein